MNPHEITLHWRRAFGEVEPGYDMAWQLRVHSLPEAKRYADTEAEYEEILARHNAAATAVLGEGTQCVLLVGLWPPNDLAVEANRLPDLPGVMFVELSDMPPSRDPDSGTVPFHAAEVVWRRGAFDDVIRDVADEKLPIIVFANLRQATAYKPYDGGADLICESPSQLANLSKEFESWLP